MTLWYTDQRLPSMTNVSHRCSTHTEWTRKDIFFPKVEFVGFRLTPEGLRPLHSNVEAIQRLPMLSSPVQIASFLEMTAYYLHFLPQYSSTTAHLWLLLKKDPQWAWTPACEDVVMQLKAQLIAPPVLALFDPPTPTLLTCDASNYSGGCAVSASQRHRATYCFCLPSS